MPISELVALVPPPATPTEAGSSSMFPDVETLVGTPLPTDLCEFGIQYGSGEFCQGEIRVFNPFSSHYKKLVDNRLDEMRQLEPFGLYGEFSIFPKRNGLLPWGDDRNGNILCWYTGGEPNSWGVALVGHGGGVEKWDLPMATFLAKAFKNEISAWQQPFAADELDFTPE